jgi:hypothetical protein
MEVFFEDNFLKLGMVEVPCGLYLRYTGDVKDNAYWQAVYYPQWVKALDKVWLKHPETYKMLFNFKDLENPPIDFMEFFCENFISKIQDKIKYSAFVMGANEESKEFIKNILRKAISFGWISIYFANDQRAEAWLDMV